MKKSNIIDRYGNNYVIKSDNSMPNLDPCFWLSSTTSSVSIKDVTNKPMIYHSWVHACVRVISRNVSRIKHVMSNNSGNNITNHTVIDLLKKPNKLMTKNSFIQLIVCYLLLESKYKHGGQAFVIPWNVIKDDKVRLDRGEIPDELFPYPEDYFTPLYENKKNGLRQVVGWKFQIPGSTSYTDFYHNEIIRISLVNPYNIIDGISSYSPIILSVEMDALSDSLNINNFSEDGRMDGVMSTEQQMSPEELSDLKSVYYEQYTGPQRRKINFISGGLKYQQFASSAADLEYLESQKWNRAKILGSFGLNRIAIGDYEDINFATIREGRKLLWHDTYIPMDQLIMDAFNSQWVNYMTGNLELSSDYSNIPALSSDLKEKSLIGATLTEKMGFPPALASRIAGIPLTEDDIKKYPYLEERPIKASPMQQAQNDDNKHIKDIFIFKSADEYVNTTIDPAAKKFRVELDKYFYRQRNLIMKNIDTYLKSKSIESITKDDISVHVWEYLPDVIIETEALRKIYTQATKIQAAYEKRTIEREWKRSIKWDAESSRIKYWTSIRSGYLKDINTTTFRKAGDAIRIVSEESISEGVTITELSKRIKEAVHEVYEVRLGKTLIEHGKFDLGGMSSSKTIARTEMGTIASMTRNEVFKSEDVKKIQWLSASDARPSHLEVNEQIIIFGSTFDNGLKFPRDPDGPPGEVINCRCAYVAVFDEE